jgi:lipoprotein-releasing system permease protein
MRAPFEWFVALRYLRGAQGRTGGARFLRFVTYVGVGGVAVGVAALLMSLMVVRGFSKEIQEKIVGFGAHVQLEHFLESPITRADTLLPLLLDFPRVEHVTPVVSGFVLLRSGPDMEGVVINGLPAEVPTFLRDRIVEGTLSFERGPDGEAGIVLGHDLASMLGLAVGERVIGMAMRDAGESGARGFARPRVVSFVLQGTYDTGLADFDRTFAYTGIDDARRLLNLPEDAVTRFEIMLSRLDESPDVARAMNEAFPVPLVARSIYQVQANLFAWVNLQQSIVPFVIGVIILVAAFNIIGLLLMLILEKTREIGILRSMGAAAGGIRRLFVSFGFMVGIAGTSVGLGLALALGLVQQRFGVVPLPEEAYYIDTAPVDIQVLDFLIVASVALALCTLAAYLPARIAARIEPVRTIRFD